jgi:hypothetical protein
VGAFAKADPKLAAVPAEFMGTEAVHRALALQSLGQLGNDRIFMRVDFTDILQAVNLLQAAGFGFGEPGSEPGRFFRFEGVRELTPTDPDVNTPDPTPSTRRGTPTRAARPAAAIRERARPIVQRGPEAVRSVRGRSCSAGRRP